MNTTLDWMKELLFLLYCLQMLQLDFAVGRWDSAESEKSLWAETRGDRRVLYVLPAPLTSTWAQIAHWKPDNYRDAKHRSPGGQLGKLWWTANKGRDFFLQLHFFKFDEVNSQGNRRKVPIGVGFLGQFRNLPNFLFLYYQNYFVVRDYFFLCNPHCLKFSLKYE